MFDNLSISRWIETLLAGAGVLPSWTPWLRLLIYTTLLSLLCVIIYFVTKRIIIRQLYRFFQKTSFEWDDLIADHKVFDNVAHIMPALLLRISAPAVFTDFQTLLPFVLKGTDIYLVIVGMTIVLAILKVSEFWLSSHPVFKDKPLNSYFQLVRIILYAIIIILVLSVLLNKSPFYFLSAFGAMTAILLLVFKDTILGLVASVQMSANDMVRIGDWVEMPKFNADGDVIAINLNTVKVQNWDKTITSIPTYYFITDSFKNWRGMVQSGGRRIKRAIFINTRSIRFVDPDTREEYKKYHLIHDAIEQRQKEIEEYNTAHNLDTSVLINGRRMTNIGVFRMYIESYLKNHPRIRQDMTIMVRQLSPESRGIPLEIYCFTSTTAWLEYEAIQADIFDHLFASASFFDIDIFQEPSGRDITGLLGAMNEGK